MCQAFLLFCPSAVRFSIELIVAFKQTIFNAMISLQHYLSWYNTRMYL